MSEEQMKLTEDGTEEAVPKARKKAAGRKKTAADGEPTPKVARMTNADVIASNERVRGEIISMGNRVEQMEQFIDILFQKIDDVRTAVASAEDSVNKSVASSRENREAPASAPENIGEYLTSRDVFNYYTKQLDRREGELADKTLRKLLIQLCTMREDFRRLVGDMEKNVKQFTAGDIIDSFSAYLVDIENMITDAGVTYGPYVSKNGKVDGQHQRVVGVIPTDKPAMDETVAESVSPGYEFEGRALIKEKVNVYKVAAQTPSQVTSFREAP